MNNIKNNAQPNQENKNLITPSQTPVPTAAPNNYTTAKVNTPNSPR